MEEADGSYKKPKSLSTTKNVLIASNFELKYL